MWGTTATNDELTGNFGSAPEDTSISDYRSVALFAEKSLKAIFGVLQHYLPHSDIATLHAPARENSRHGVYSSQTLETSITPL
jgi:hypothetical protein